MSNSQARGATTYARLVLELSLTESNLQT